MNSQLKTILLLGILGVFLVALGGVLGGRSGLYWAFGFSLFVNVITYFFSDRLALLASNAQLITKDETPQLYQMVEELVAKAGIPMPRLYIIPVSQANAFATGRNPRNSAIAVTQGLLDLLSPAQIRAVLAHEVGHIKNRDVLIASVAAVLASAITFISRIGLYGGGESSTDRRGGGGLAILMAVFGPIAALLIQLAISRQREFVADAYAKKLLGDGEPLAQALLIIEESTRRAPLLGMNPAFSSLYIGNPLGEAGGLVRLFSTHPPVKERVARLRR